MTTLVIIDAVLCACIALCLIHIKALREQRSDYLKGLPFLLKKEYTKGFHEGRTRPPHLAGGNHSDDDIRARERAAYELGVKHTNEAWCARIRETAEHREGRAA